MKTSMKSLLGIVLCILLVSSCRKDNPGNSKGSVVFKFQTTDVSAFKSSGAEAGPIAAALIVTIYKNKGGEPTDLVYGKEKLELSYLNGAYISKGLPMPQGAYYLTEFLVTDASNKIIYAAPKAGSDLAQLVAKPLPLYFYINSNTESTISPEVLKTDTSSLEDLGYSGFSFNYVKSTKFLMSVFYKSAGGSSLEHVDSSHLFITSPKGKNYNYILKGGTANPVYVNSDSGNYILTVWSKGYTSLTDTLTLNQLGSHTTMPLNMVLTSIESPMIWFLASGSTTIPYSGPSIITRSVTDFYVDWGDGIHEKITTLNNSFTFRRFNKFADNRLVQIWGNLADIRDLSFGGAKYDGTFFLKADINNASGIEDFHLSYVTLRDFSLENLTTLKNINYYFCSAPVKVRNCQNLENLTLIASTPAQLDIQTNNKLQFLQFSGYSSVMYGTNPSLMRIVLADYYPLTLTVDKLNNLFIGLLASVESSPRTGTFECSKKDIKPTGEGLQAAQTLKNTYHWTISPDIE
ncbi:MAG TPA: hypothetical protein VIH57_26145 [Bacteroidales bacterium]